MKKALLLTLVLPLVWALPAAASTHRTRAFELFVSNPHGKILKVEVDGTSATVKRFFDGPINPEDMVVGPDGNLYVCDTSNDRIVRISRHGGGREIVYAKSERGDPRSPQGPSFLGFDLYFNTEHPHSGVWKIPAVATVPFGDPIGDPELVVRAQARVIGEGTRFGLDGTLLFVDRNNGQVFGAAPPAFDEPEVLIDGLDDPVGVAVAPNGDVFVADHGAKKIRACSRGELPSSAGDCDAIRFGYHERPLYMEFDLSGQLFVVTAKDLRGNRGKLWLVETNGSFDKTPLARFDKALGIALPPTRTSDTKGFTGDTLQTEKFDCGSSQMVVTMQTECRLTIHCKEVLPSLLNADIDASPLDGTCIQYDYNRGFCLEYSGKCEHPTGPVDFYFGYLRFNDTPSSYPAVLSRDDKYSEFEDITTGYFSLGGLLEDPGRGGNKEGFSDFVLADLALTTPEAEVGGFEKPLSDQCASVDQCPGGVPEFKAGRTLPIKFRVKGVPKKEIKDLVARVSIAIIDPPDPVNPTIPVTPTGHSNDGNLVRFSKSGRGIYNLKLVKDDYPPGLYNLNVVSDAFGFQSTLFRIVEH